MAGILAVDILERIAREFPESTQQAQLDLSELATSCINGQRVVRCVLHLASGDQGKLDHFIQAAREDERDVIWWAEYDEDEHVRDFIKEFS